MVVEGVLEKEILELVPQQDPFRFIDSIISVEKKGIMGGCQFQPDAFFYQGHFPGDPVTPGVILIEALAQTGVVALGIFLMLSRGDSPAEISLQRFLFACTERITFDRVVKPGERVVIRGEIIYFRRNQLKSRVAMFGENGAQICSGILVGRGAKSNA